MKDYTVKSVRWHRRDDPLQEAIQLGAAGPTLRGSAWLRTCARRNTKPSRNSGSRPVSVLDGDCWARTKVRFLEVLQSMEIVRQAISHLPDTEINVKVKGNPSGEVISRVEQPRGECMYYVKGNGSKYLDRVRIRTPTFANIPPLLHMVKGISLPTFPSSCFPSTPASAAPNGRRNSVMLMINTILRNFLKRPATRKYPMVKRDPFSNYRGRLINNVESCIFCRMCSTKCPGAVHFHGPEGSFLGI